MFFYYLLHPERFRFARTPVHSTPSVSLSYLLFWIAFPLSLLASFVWQEVWVPWQLLLIVGKAELCFGALFMTRLYVGWYVSTGFTRRRFHGFAAMSLLAGAVGIAVMSGAVYFGGRIALGVRMEEQPGPGMWQGFLYESMMVAASSAIFLFVFAYLFFAAGVAAYRYVSGRVERSAVVVFALIAALVPIPTLGNADNLILLDYMVASSWMPGAESNFYELSDSPANHLFGMLRAMSGTGVVTAALQPAVVYACSAAVVPVVALIVHRILRTAPIRADIER